MIPKPTPRERERWHALWLLAQGWTSSTTTAQALQRDPYTIGPLLQAQEGVGHRGGRAHCLGLRAVRGFPPAPRGQALHRLGFVFKRPKKRLLQADEAKRKAFITEYAALRYEAGRTGGKIFFADEAHSRADAELRGKWVLKGEPALVDSSSPRHGEKASCYSAVCWETGELEWMELEGNSNGESSVAFLEQLRERRGGRFNVIWDNAPAHRGPAMRSYLESLGLNLRLVNPRFHEGRLCRATARTATRARRSGAG